MPSQGGNNDLNQAHLSSNSKKRRLESTSLSSTGSTSDEMDFALAKFFFGCNISFNVVESRHFKDFIALLSPTYKPPTRKRLSTKLLDVVHRNLLEEREEERVSLHGSEGVLLIDGWKNSSANTKNVVCTIHTIDSKSIFLKSWDLTSMRETGEQLKKIVDEGVCLAKEKFKISIYAVVSDNASAMISMEKKVDIWHTTCHSHSGNLLAKAFVPEKFTKKVNELLREFKTPSAENEIKKLGGSRIILACETRWCSYRDAFRCLLKNFHLMKTLCDEQKIKFSNESVTLLKDPSFATELQDYILIFDPICQLINVCQRANCSLADGCEEWLRLVIPTVSDELQQLMKDRLEKVLTPIVLTSNFLHPKYCGKQFIHDEEKMKLVETFLKKELRLKAITQESGIMSYKENSGIFSKLSARNYESPQAFWTAAAPFYPDLSHLAKRLSGIPAASAQLERLFSSWAFIHSDLRNRLTVDRSMKLVDVYYSLKMSELHDHHFDDLIDED